MTTSPALPSAFSFPLGSPSKHDPALKPNPHPYAIKTTHTALLSRSNSSGHNTPSKYSYVPSSGTPSRSPTKHAHGYRGHRYSTSLTGDLPTPLPSPLPSPTHSQRSGSEDDSWLRRRRADTLPTYLADNSDAPSAEPKEDLPLNPKTWTPSQLSVYLTSALRVRSGEQLPERVARDVALWVRREGVSGRTFLRWTDENLKVLGVNMLWRSALLGAARNLRQNILRGRIWGNPTSDPDQEQEKERRHGDIPFGTTLYALSSSSLDLPLTDGGIEAGSEQRLTRPLRVSTNGHVRGMVVKWERESAGCRSPTGSLRGSSHSRSGSESDNGSDLGEGDVAVEEDVDMDSARNDEPSIEELLAAGSPPSAPSDSSWGARAWEELDPVVTMRRVELHDTVVPRRDGSGGASGSRRRLRGTNKNDLEQLTRLAAAEIFAEPPDTVSTHALAEAGVQADVCAKTDMEGAEEEETAAVDSLQAKELVLESEMEVNRTLLEEFRRRLEKVEACVSSMEAAEWLSEQQQSQAQRTSPAAVEPLPTKAIATIEGEGDTAAACIEERGMGGQDNAAENSNRPAGAGDHDAYAEGRVVPPVADLGPKAMSDLPSYVLMVGLGVCAVVLQVVLKRVGGRSLKP